jgi:hypothetical protein
MSYPRARFFVIVIRTKANFASLWANCAMRGSAQQRLQPIEFGPMGGGMSVKLCAEGTGTAWFDDVELMEVAR